MPSLYIKMMMPHRFDIAINFAGAYRYYYTLHQNDVATSLWRDEDVIMMIIIILG